MKNTILYATLALTLVATLRPTRVNAASWQYAVCTRLLAANDIGIGLIATPVKTVASNMEHIDASALSEDVYSYVDGSIGDFHKVGFLDSLANDVKDFLQNVLSCIANTLSHIF